MLYTQVKCMIWQFLPQAMKINMISSSFHEESSSTKHKTNKDRSTSLKSNFTG